MEKAIYKITNNINQKIYIGQSKSPENRWRQHCHKKENYAGLIGRAIQKYGEKNFSFEVIEWTEDYNEREKYWIAYYNSLKPYGYNILSGGEEPPHYSGENNSYAKISNETARKIQEQAMDWNIPRKQIVKSNKITFDIFRHINDGSSWHRDDLTYPLRPGEKELNEIKAKKVIDMLKNTTLTHVEIGKKVGWSKAAITMINIGQNHFDENESYPIRKNTQIKPVETIHNK